LRWRASAVVIVVDERGRRELVGREPDRADIPWVKDIRESWSARKQLEERCRGQPTWVVSLMLSGMRRMEDRQSKR
jgi:hypothetical protein